MMGPRILERWCACGTDAEKEAAEARRLLTLKHFDAAGGPLESDCAKSRLTCLLGHDDAQVVWP